MELGRTVVVDILGWVKFSIAKNILQTKSGISYFESKNM